MTPTQTSTQTAIALIQTTRALLGTVLGVLEGENPQDLNPEALKNLLALMEGGQAPETPNTTTGIDPEWFKPGKNHHMSPKGIKFCFDCWEKNMSEQETAKRMGIFWRAVRLRYDKFQAGERP